MFYLRYFKVTSGEIFNALEEKLELKRLQSNDIFNFAKSLGAVEVKVNYGFGIVGLIFKEKPDPKLWKLGRFGYIPKRNTKEGRELYKKFKSFPITNEQDALEKVGLDSDICLIHGNRAYKADLFGDLDKKVILVRVPWLNVAQEQMDEYKKTRGEKWYSSNYEHLLWTPPPELEEIKEWEYLKIIDELKVN